MTAAATKAPFADASPAQIREALLAEELPQFEQEYEAALQEAAQTYRLDTLNRVLECWRRIAWMTSTDPETHRLMLARAEYAQATRQMAPADASAAELRELLASR